MGKMKNLVMEIEELLIAGLSPDEIAQRLAIPINLVYETEDNLVNESFSDYSNQM